MVATTIQFTISLSLGTHRLYVISVKDKYYLECIRIDYLLVQYNSAAIANIGDMDRIDIHFTNDLRTGPQSLFFIDLLSTTDPADIVADLSNLSNEDYDDDASSWIG